MQRQRYWRLSLLQFLQYFVHGSWFVTAGTYLLQNLGFSGREVGLSYGAMAIAATVTPFLMGRLADRLWASERMLAGLHLAGGATLLLLSTIKVFVLFYPVMLLYALLFMPTMALTNALCFHHIRDGRRDFPRIRVWGTIGWILAGGLVSLLNAEALALPMRIAGSTALVLGGYCFTLPHTPPPGARGPFRAGSLFFGPDMRQLFRRRNIVVLIIALVLISIPASFYYSFVNPFLTEQGVAGSAGKMALGQVTEIAVMLALPFFFRHLGMRRILFLGLLAWGLRYTFFAWGAASGATPGLYLGILLHGLAFNFTVLATQIFLDRHVPESLRSTIQGLISLATQGLGALLGTVVAGEVVNFFTTGLHQHYWPAIWSVPAAVGAAAALFFILAFRPKGAEDTAE